ncbi:hypothetical protein G7Y89_g406 [Cudoniella acicularis]|uniref:Zn(2)-C6 fungal-type domain-containing protein n=1 Tax=Cudoniella acicularis TaxID=354080 RepID=A0A8H4RXB3_9HELO|nr:hypothetical protein G7Y89_g406 [Cudoniella acicularis]
MSEARRVKSRAGCLQCKRRKVKCDLAVPGCQQCRRQKLSCPGYQKPLKWIDGPEDPKSKIPQARSMHQFNSSEVAELNREESTSGLEGSGTSCLHMQVPSISPQLDHESSSLIHHYFTRVCRIAGCFDSSLSPFRTVSASMMTYSKPVLLFLQASSAAQLSRQHPQMRFKALKLQSEAFSAVRNEIGNLQGPVVSDELMLSCIIAGLTSAWYDVNDIGLSHVSGSQVLLSLWLMSQRGRLKYQQTFILGSYIYWFMNAAFVAGDPRESFHYQEALQYIVRNLDMSHDIINDSDIPEHLRKVLPHPLTGFSMQLCISVGKVGSLCRLRYSCMAQPNYDELQEFLEERAQYVESELLELVQSYQSNFKDPEDPHTTVEEILSVGEAYRCAGLLQLYTTFPHLLQQQVQLSSRNTSGNSETELPQEMETMRLDSIAEFTTLQHNWLRALSFHILKILETIPPTSGTRALQGLPVLIAATWLVDPMNDDSSGSDEGRNQIPFEHPHLPLRKSSSSKEYWRQLVQVGLRQHNEYVSLQQVSRILEIVEEIWRLDDKGEEKCHWMVVVASKGLQTLYG